MFQIKEVDPVLYRSKTKKATIIIMIIFIAIGFLTARYAVKLLGEYSSNLIVLNFLGAFVGLFITFLIVKWFFIDKKWMSETMYGWRLKRNLMYITNVLRHVQEASDSGDIEAMKILRFYHLGLTQMHKLENNSHSLIDLKAEKQVLERSLVEQSINLNQTSFDFKSVERFKPKKT